MILILEDVDVHAEYLLVDGLQCAVQALVLQL